jgi:hypothetical protein
LVSAAGVHPISVLTPPIKTDKLPSRYHTV